MSTKIFVLLSLQLHVIKKTVNAETEFQPTNLAEPVDCGDSGLIQLPESIKLQTSGAVLSRHLMLDESFAAKLSKENALEIVNQNKQNFEPNGDLIDSYIHQLHHRERYMFSDD